MSLHGPKLHGNNKRMEEVVVDFARFFEQGAVPAGKPEADSGLKNMPLVKRTE